MHSLGMFRAIRTLYKHARAFILSALSKIMRGAHGLNPNNFYRKIQSTFANFDAIIHSL